MHKKDEIFRDQLSRVIMSVVDDTVRRHWRRPTQEPQLTAKIAHDLDNLRGVNIMGNVISVSVVAQDIPDRGQGSLEAKTGADLYIGLKIKTLDSELCKGLLIQAKWDEPMPTRERERLKDQCKELSARSPNGAFVWAYGPSGTKVIPAGEYYTNPTSQLSDLSNNNVEELFIDVMNCVSGDPSLAPARIFDDPDAIEDFLKEIAANYGVLIGASPAAAAIE